MDDAAPRGDPPNGSQRLSYEGEGCGNGREGGEEARVRAHCTRRGPFRRDALCAGTPPLAFLKAGQCEEELRKDVWLEKVECGRAGSHGGDVRIGTL